MLQSNINIILFLFFRDPQTFLSSVDKYNVPYLSRTILLIQKIIVISKANDDNDNIRYALKFLSVIIENLKGKIDTVVQEIIFFLINEITDTKTRKSNINTILQTVFKYIILL
jgi:hypothetical protein